MADSSPTLLSLPRELRNTIYDFLAHEVEFVWCWHKHPELGLDGLSMYRCVNIRIQNMPVPAVFSVCSRLKEEYLGAKCFKHLTARAEPHTFSKNGIGALLGDTKVDKIR